MKAERRTFKVELRKKKTEGQPTEIEGHAAVFNELSVDMYGWRERVMPGAFTRAIKEKQDVRALINHDPNLVLARSTSGTLSLTEDKAGLVFNCSLPSTTYASDLAAVMERGDIDQCSFGFIARKTTWSEEPDPDNDKNTIIVRQLEDVDLFDVSVVTYPAYPQTDAGVRAEMRTAALESAPEEIRKKLAPAEPRAKRENENGCDCDCPECMDGDCSACSNADCDDANCMSSDRSRALNRVRAIRATL